MSAIQQQVQVRAAGRAVADALVSLLVLVLRAYKWVLSPMLGAHCRFVPSCSQYAIDALRARGPARGGWLALRRVSRCHPLHEGGFDPVPDR